MIALTIAGSDSGGGAGIQADLKTFAALGVHGVSVVTSITAQNTLAVRETFDLPVRFIKAQFDAIHEDFDVRAAKTGMLGNNEIVEIVAREVGRYPLIVDPVLRAESGAELLEEGAVEVLKNELFPKALLVTPNIFEAEVLSGLKIKDTEDVREACRIISRCGCNVVIKGGHLEATDVLYYKGRFYEFEGEKVSQRVHGSGCIFSSAITAGIAKGGDLLSAVREAKVFTTKAIVSASKPGRGARVASQLGLKF